MRYRSVMSADSDSANVARWTANYVGERQGAALYEALASVEKDPRRSEILRQMAAVEVRHAARWEEKLRRAGIEPPAVRQGHQERIICWLARRIGVEAVLPLVRGMELRAAGGYAGQNDAFDLIAEERGHARTLAAMTEGRTGSIGDVAPTGADEAATAILGRERWHRRDRGGSLRAAVFGVNDGLVSNLSLVIGVAGADPAPHFILLAGVSGLLAGAFSMAAGEYVSIS